ncbi:hypothetical protein D3C81_2040650 [compost metagenome]
MLDTGIDDLQRRDHPLSGFQYIEHGDVWTLEWLAQDERQLYLYPRHDKAIKWNVASFVEQHVVEQGAVVGFGDVRRYLHGA